MKADASMAIGCSQVSFENMLARLHERGLDIVQTRDFALARDALRRINVLSGMTLGDAPVEDVRHWKCKRCLATVKSGGILVCEWGPCPVEFIQP